MSQFFTVHPENPQPRLMREAVKIIQAGGVIVFPTDSAYAIGCRLGEKGASDRIRVLRHLEETHFFTLICRDLSELSTYAVVDNAAFRLLKAHTPGPFTFILPATREVPSRLLQPKRKTIGLRVPDSKIVSSLLDLLGEPLMSVTLVLPDQDQPLFDAESIREALGQQVDLIIDGGACSLVPTTVVDLVGPIPTVLRVGKGELYGS